MTNKLAGFAAIGMLLLALAVGCSSAGGNRLILKSSPDYNIEASMYLPTGWSLESTPKDGVSLYSDNINPENRGGTIIYSAEGKSLSDWIDTNYIGEAEKTASSGEVLAPLAENFMGEEAGEAAKATLAWELLSREPIKIGNLEAEETVAHYYGKRQVRVFVKKEDLILEVGLISVPEDWEKNEPLFRKSLATLKVR